MQKEYEYHVDVLTSARQDQIIKLNHYGKQGWKLVAVHGQDAYFMREKPKQDEK